MAFHHLAKFGGHRYCNSRNIMFLVCHVIKHDQVNKGSGDYSDRRPLKVSHGSAKFGGHRHFGSRDIMILVCHMI